MNLRECNSLVLIVFLLAADEFSEQEKVNILGEVAKKVIPLISTYMAVYIVGHGKRNTILCNFNLLGQERFKIRRL